MSKIIGIDLGTTNSAVAIIEGGQPKIIENIENLVISKKKKRSFNKKNQVCIQLNQKQLKQ